MRVEIERWLTGRKSLLTIPVVLVLIAEVWGWLLQPPQPDINAGGTPRIQAQWRKLLPLRAALQNVGIDEQQTQAFSPIDLPVTGPALFSWLARCGMRATAFSMQPENQALRLILQLEAEDAP